jgi:hypothetical protein
MRKINVLTVVAAMCWATGVLAATPVSYTIDHEVKFEPGDPKWTARLRNTVAVGDLVDYEYMIALEDLNDDQQPEVIVLASSSDFCGSGGCLMIVLDDHGSGRLDPILQQYVTPPLAVTREKQGGYRLLAISNGKGGIEIADRPGAPMHGKPLVWAMQPVAVTR